MDTGYDAYLDRCLEEHEARGYEDDRIAELVAARAIEIGNDAEEFLAWIAERDTRLWDINVTSPFTGKKVAAAAALIAHAPAWLRELVLDAGDIDAESLMDARVQYASGRTCPADVALMVDAPVWLRGALTDWLAAQPALEAEVRASIEYQRESEAEDRAAAIAESRWL